jgi:hypothetical protein
MVTSSLRSLLRLAPAAAVVVACLGFFAAPSHAQFPGGFGDDVRLTTIGGSGSILSSAAVPDVALDPISGNYLVVWEADDPDHGLVDNEREIFARVFAADGTPLSTVFQVSSVVPAFDQSRDASDPVVAYDAAEDTFIVAWAADDALFGADDQETEIFARAIGWDAITGLWSASLTQRVSDVQAAGVAGREARFPAIAFA